MLEQRYPGGDKIYDDLDEVDWVLTKNYTLSPFFARKGKFVNIDDNDYHPRHLGGSDAKKGFMSVFFMDEDAECPGGTNVTMAAYEMGLDDLFVDDGLANSRRK